MKLHLTDLLSFDAKNLRETRDGYLVAAPRVARTGIQLYAGKEIGGEFKDKDVVRVYRPEEEVFRADAMRSLSHRPLTNDHPSVQVTSENWRQYAVGQTDQEVVRDGEFVRCPMLFMDKKAIADIKGGKRQLSVGYDCEIDPTPGTSPKGEAYDAVQRNIQANHIALVKAARGGARLSVGDELEVSLEDSQQQGDDMTEKTLRQLVIDGISVDMTDTAVQVVQRALADANSRLETAVKDAKTAKETADKSIADLTTSVTTLTKDKETLTAENATLKQQLADAKLKPEVLDQMVTDRQETIAKATALLGDKLVVKGKTDGEIMRQVVDAKLGDAAKGWNEDQVKTSFATITVDVKAGSTAVADASRAFSGKSPAQDDKREKAYQDANKRLTEAWRHPNGAPTH